ncbi:cAMP-regulated phosphoprotein 21 isoform X2 [Phyllopteryx taeniolatus]|uniref:cAMP-regulated phosphoprotein 21 isoform X2 n=1 Tax=Phyllopteryx taeniolatus TaxID=161469 RepID=UPI002AD37AE2|nr:cAMP-regulated phosphoprotein 21 isoform X2 [Phyllopteryx taeniolatus]
MVEQKRRRSSAALHSTASAPQRGAPLPLRLAATSRRAMDPAAAVQTDHARHVTSYDVTGSPPATPRPSREDGDQTAAQKRVKAKGKLVRSVAVCDDEYAKEEDVQTPPDDGGEIGGASCREEEVEKTSPLSKVQKMLESGGSSVSYRDSTGVDLHRFIVDTLNSNPRDRMMMLKLEQDMVTFITGDSAFKKFPHMSSYHRMLVHRVAAFFGMEHNVDQTGKSVIINRTSSTRIPEQRFLDQVQEDKATEIQHWKTILKRDSSSDEQTRRYTSRDKQNKSVEEREEEYQRVREKIFSQEPVCTQEGGHVESRSAAEECNPYAETQRRRQLFRGSRDSSGSSWTGGSRHSSTDTDCRYGNEPRPWSSTDSDSSTYRRSAEPRPPRAANPGREPRGAAGSVSLFRLPCEPAATAEPAPHPAYVLDNGIPPGSILVNPHTGQPFLNPDGSPVVYNPPCAQQPIRSQPQAAPAQQPPQQVYSSVVYTAPQMLPVAPSQPFAAVEDLSQQFAHVAVSCQSAGEATPLYPAAQGFGFAAPPPAAPQQAPNPHGYCQPSPQVPSFYYSQYPTSAQQSAKAASPGCAAGYAPVAGVPQQQSYATVTPHHCSVLQGAVTVYQPSKVGEAGYCCVVAPAPPPHCGPTWTA